MDIDAMEKAAKAATKGPYMAGAYGALGDISVIEEDGSAVGNSVLFVQAIQGDTYNHKQRIANTEYFAMLDPATVLELVRLARIGEQCDGICKWKVDEDEGCVWDTECGQSLYFDAATPKENGVKFCSHCGKTMIQEPPQ